VAEPPIRSIESPVQSESCCPLKDNYHGIGWIWVQNRRGISEARTDGGVTVRAVKVVVVIIGLALLLVGLWLCIAAAAPEASSTYFLARLFGGIAVLTCGFAMVGWGTGYFGRMKRRQERQVEQRRRAWELHQQGVEDAAIAQELGTAPKTVHKWVTAQQTRSDRR
jgi:hypothetical protein